MVQGLLNSYLDKIFRDIQFVYILSSVDDLLIFKKTKEKHIKHLSEVIHRLSKHNLTVNLKKSKVVSHRSYLGNIISKNSIHIDSARTKSLEILVHLRMQRMCPVLLVCVHISASILRTILS